MTEANGLHHDTSGMERRIEARLEGKFERQLAVHASQQKELFKAWLDGVKIDLNGRFETLTANVVAIREDAATARVSVRDGDGRVWQLVVFGLGGALGLITSVAGGVVVYFITKG